eukprot:Gb_17252 [translate_table: standard]
MRSTVALSLILRCLAFVLLMISFVAMLASKTTSGIFISVGSYSDYAHLTYQFKDFNAFKYVVAAGIIGCMYSLFQIAQGIYLLFTGARLLPEPFSLYFDIVCDQVVAYLIMSSASAGIACITLARDFFKSGDGLYNDAAKKFLRIASASVSMEFLGFLVMAVCVLLSLHNVFQHIVSARTVTVPVNEAARVRAGSVTAAKAEAA